jgi:hypothetical protein
MKYTISLFLVLTGLISQAQTANEGYTFMESGKGDSTRVKYHVESSDIDKLPKDKLNMMLRSAYDYGIRDCKNQSSFRPSKRSTIWIARIVGGWHLVFNFLAQNSYGTEGELTEEVIFDKQFNYTSHNVKSND